MRAVSVASASVAALFLSFGSGPAAACYGCQGGYYSSRWRRRAGRAAGLSDRAGLSGRSGLSGTDRAACAGVSGGAGLSGCAGRGADVADRRADAAGRGRHAGPTYVGGPGYNGNGYYSGNGNGYYDGNGNGYYGGPRGRTVYYERGPEYQVGYREYAPYNYGVPHLLRRHVRRPRRYYNGGYYGEPAYYGGGPYYRPYYPRPTVCSGGAYETGQAICGMRP